MSLRRRRTPADPDRAKLVVEEIGVVVVRVRFAHGGMADLDVIPPELAPSLDGRVGRLVSVTGDGISGRLSLGWAPGHVRFSREGLQRRVHTRVPVDFNAVLVPERLDSMWRVHVRDVSAGGALMADTATLPLGARLEMQLALSEDEATGLTAPFWTTARVVRAPAAHLRAVRFEALDTEVRARLQRYVLLEQIRRAES